MTYNDYRTLPEGGPQYQLFEGELLTTPGPTILHQRISRNLEYLWFDYFRKTKNGEIFDAPTDVILSETDIVQPDLLVLRPEHYDRIKDEGIRGAPDLVVEILSPSTAPLDVGVKRRLYAQHGVEELWFVDPARYTIEIYQLQRSPGIPTAVFHYADVAHSFLFPDFAAPLAEIFPTLR